MNTTPSLIIVTNRGHLVAYRTTSSHSLEIIDTAKFSEGTDKISDIVTDQSGSFSNGNGQGTSSYESLPFANELEQRCFRQIAERIRGIIDRQNPGKWGLATPSEINGKILEGLSEDCLRKLEINLKSDLTNSPPDQVLKRFEKAAEPV